MRPALISVLSFVLIGTSALASPQADPAAAAPQGAMPVTQAANQSGKLLILPFGVTADSTPWAGKAIQQNLFTDLIRGAKMRVEAPETPAPADATAALRAGRDANASLVVFGNVQSVGNEMRITGQVLDVATGNAVGGLKATGPARELFKLEDAVAAQVVQALPPAMVNPAAPAVNPAPVTTPAPQIYTIYTPYTPPVAPAPSYSYTESPSYTYTYVNDYTSTPDYGNYGYAYGGYPYYYPLTTGFIYTGGFNRFGRLGFQRGGFNRGPIGGFNRGGGIGFRGNFSGGFAGRAAVGRGR